MSDLYSDKAGLESRSPKSVQHIRVSLSVCKAGPLTLCLLQATLFDPQLHDGSCIYERVASIVDGEQRVGRVVKGQAAWDSSWVGAKKGEARLSWCFR